MSANWNAVYAIRLLMRLGDWLLPSMSRHRCCSSNVLLIVSLSYKILESPLLQAAISRQ